MARAVRLAAACALALRGAAGALLRAEQRVLGAQLTGTPVSCSSINLVKDGAAPDVVNHYSLWQASTCSSNTAAGGTINLAAPTTSESCISRCSRLAWVARWLCGVSGHCCSIRSGVISFKFAVC